MPDDEVKICGRCRWHHDLTGLTEGDDIKHCLAQPYPRCLDILSRSSARCTLPHLFAPITERTPS